MAGLTQNGDCERRRSKEEDVGGAINGSEKIDQKRMRH